jgi:hypothetical protein
MAMICSRAEVLTHLGLDQPSATPAEEKLLRSHLALVNALQPRVERLVQTALGYQVATGHYIEYLPPMMVPAATDPLVEGALDLSSWGGAGAGISAFASAPTLQLANVPVRAITSIHENDNAWQNGPGGYWPADTLLTYGTDYLLDVSEDGLCRSGIVLRPGGSWSLTPRSIRVEYDAGWTPDELDNVASDIKLAVLVSMTKWFNETRANQPADDFLGTGAIQSEGFAGLSVSYARAAENSGLQFALPAAALRLLEPYVRYRPF